VITKNYLIKLYLGQAVKDLELGLVLEKCAPQMMWEVAMEI